MTASDNVKIEQYIKEIIHHLGDDPKREGLEETPRRVVKALHYLTSGYSESIDKIVKSAIFNSDMDEMVIVKNIELYSLCQHHMLPFIGKCHVAYIPNGKIIGLSKIPRIIEIFARRLQLQEKLTKQIAQCVMDATQAHGVATIIEAQHLCMMMRGIQKQNSVMTTSVMLGSFREDARTRAEFLNLVKG